MRQEHHSELLSTIALSGTGSSIYPLLSTNSNPKLQIKAYDYSAQAIKFFQANPMYSSAQMTSDAAPSEPIVGSVSASVWDITSPRLPFDLPEGSADIIILIFVLSALRPEEWAIAVNNIYKVDSFMLFENHRRLRIFRSSNRLDDCSCVIMAGMISRNSDSKRGGCLKTISISEVIRRGCISSSWVCFLNLDHFP